MTEKTYLENPYLREFKGKVIKKEKVNDMYHIYLNRTIFYPNIMYSELKDKGTINGIEVVDVFEKGEYIVHVLKENVSSKDVNILIDWNNRFDYMQQHTGQHLLSASIHKLYDKETINFRLDESYAYIEINIEKIKDEDINRIEKFANSIIHSNFKIKTYELSKGNQSEIELGIRVAEIDNIYITPCESIHCSNSGEVGMIKILDYEKNGKEDIVIKFVCGNRALRDYEKKNECINNVSKLLSLEETDIYKGVELLLEKKEKLEEQVRILREEIRMYNQK